MVLRVRVGASEAERRRIAEEIRPKVRDACELRSINKVAAEIGVTSSSVKYFLRVGTPYVHTLTRLANWYNGRVRTITVAALIELLPSGARAGAVTALISALRQACSDAGAALPDAVLVALDPGKLTGPSA